MGGESDCKEGGAPQQGRWVQSQLGSLRVPGGMGIWTGFSSVSFVTVDPLRNSQAGISRVFFATLLHEEDFFHLKYLFCEKDSAFKASFHKEVLSESAEFQGLPEDIAFYLPSCPDLPLLYSLLFSFYRNMDPPPQKSHFYVFKKNLSSPLKDL